jgi:holo-[acyl-carrier protein] synthase
MFTGISGIGVDIIEIGRIQKAVEKSGEKFLQRVYTPDEQAYCAGKRHPFASYAVRFAAKEAVLKALGAGVSGGYSLSEVEVVSLPGGKPIVKLHNNIAKIALEKGVEKVLLSLSHDQRQAIAFAIAIQER